MSHSNSSLNTFANCMKKYEHNYILHTKPDMPPSVHLGFGTMAHEVLYKAGKLRDEVNDGITPEYETIIPSEILYPEYKNYFGIQNWHNYFTSVIKQVSKYEQELISEMLEKTNGVTIARELKLQITPTELYKQNLVKNITEPLVGIIDLLLIGENYATIIDYKFSSSKKTQDDFDNNSQLQLYTFFVHQKYGIDLRNIKIGYIDIPKQEFGIPTVLGNGTLSRAKSQNVSQEMYKAAIEAVHGDNPVYNCEPGGYYYDCYCNLAMNKAAYLTCQYLDLDTYEGIMTDLFNTIDMIEFMKQNKMPFLRKYDSYSCKNCEYLSSCKYWLNLKVM